MVRQLREPPVTGITTTPAGAHIGTQVFAVVGTDEHTAPHLTRRPVRARGVLKKPQRLLAGAFHVLPLTVRRRLNIFLICILI